MGARGRGAVRSRRHLSSRCLCACQGFCTADMSICVMCIIDGLLCTYTYIYIYMNVRMYSVLRCRTIHTQTTAYCILLNMCRTYGKYCILDSTSYSILIWLWFMMSYMLHVLCSIFWILSSTAKVAYCPGTLCSTSCP